MFRNRRSSHKPSAELYQSFKNNYPLLRRESQAESADSDHNRTPTLIAALDVAGTPSNVSNSDHALINESNQFQDWTFPMPGMTPSFFDANDYAFNPFSHQQHGQFAATPGGTHMVHHSQHAGDLHTPGFTFSMDTPTSMQTSGGLNNLHHAQLQSHLDSTVHNHSQDLKQPAYRNINPFMMHDSRLFPVQTFQHDAMQQQLNGPMQCSPDQTPVMSEDMDAIDQAYTATTEIGPSFNHPLKQRFRYKVTLAAPTAMVKRSEDVPVTYLNKGQPYVLTLSDSMNLGCSTSTTYRTFIRVSFEDDEQRKDPAACWQLWKEGRGSNEAHLRAGRLQAVEYAGNSPDAPKDTDSAHVQVQNESFDGFSVTWSQPASSREVSIPVRFNFLSTDFSHSKGVKGIPVRLCAKTEIVQQAAAASEALSESEVCYCRVKLFRDHGAERKLANDIAHVKKTIDKTTAHIAQLASGLNENGKRKRSGTNADGHRPSKTPKYRRAWSVSSGNSGGQRSSAEEELHNKLATMQDMFSSTQATSLFFLIGEEGDDPDTCPVVLAENPEENDSLLASQPRLVRQDSKMLTPNCSGLPVPGLEKRTSDLSTASSSTLDQSNNRLQELHSSNPQNLASPPTQAISIHKQSKSAMSPDQDCINAFGIDDSYKCPDQVRSRPVACFYILPRIGTNAVHDDFHRAIYLRKRSLLEFVQAAASKADIDPSCVVRTVRKTPNGLQVLFDDEAIGEIPEGQDMITDFCALDSVSSIKAEDSATKITTLYELKLIY